MKKTIEGYLILLLCCFIFTMWGINLFSLSDIEINTPSPDGKPTSKAPSGGGTRTIIKKVIIKPKPFLYYYLRRLGYTIHYTSKLPYNDSRLMILFDPPDTLRPRFKTEILPWVRNGGNLLIFFSEHSRIAEAFGAEIKKGRPETREDPANPLPHLEEVRDVTSSYGAVNIKKGASFVPHLADESGNSTVLSTYRGKGQIVIVSNAELFYPDGLQKADNIVLVTRLVENITSGTTVYMYSPDPDFAIQARVRTNTAAPPRPITTVKKKVPHKTLWSMIKANPISWVLAQMLIGLIVYFYAMSRRFTRPVPLPEEGYSVDTYVSSMGRLYMRMQAASFTAERLLFEFLSALRRRLGLPAEEDDRQIFERLKTTHPHLVTNLRTAMKGLETIIKEEQRDSTKLVRYIRILEATRKELKIYD